MIPTISDRCFLTTSINTPGFSKQAADYNCKINGGSLASIETLTKLNAVVNWLKSKSLSKCLLIFIHLFFNFHSFIFLDTKQTQEQKKASYFWLNTASQRNNSLNATALNGFSSNWTWVWVSGISNSYASFSYDNWGPFQSTNFNGDSVYLNASDFRFYVGLSSQSYFNSSFQYAGVLCESAVNGLSTSQINLLPISSSQAYTSSRFVLLIFLK
jgi:hypothetical protein